MFAINTALEESDEASVGLDDIFDTVLYPCLLLASKTSVNTPAGFLRHHLGEPSCICYQSDLQKTARRQLRGFRMGGYQEHVHIAGVLKATTRYHERTQIVTTSMPR